MPRIFMSHAHFAPKSLRRALPGAAAGAVLALGYALALDELSPALGSAAALMGVLLAAGAGTVLGSTAAFVGGAGIVAATFLVPGHAPWLATPLGTGAWMAAMGLGSATGAFLHARRHASARALRSLQRRHRRLVENVRDVLFETDAEGRWTFLNPSWTEITGHSVAESLGHRFLEFVHPDDRGRSEAAFLSMFRGDDPYTRDEARCRTADGGYRWVEVTARLNRAPDGRVLGATGRLMDMTEQRAADAALRRAGEALARRDAVLRAIPRAGRALLGTARGPVNILPALEVLARAMDADRACVFQFHAGDGGEPLMTKRYEWVAPGVASRIDSPASRNVPLRDPGYAPWVEPLAAGGAAILDPRELPEPARTGLLEQEIRAFAVVPVQLQGETWGLLGFDDCRGGRGWGEAELDGLRAAAEMLGAGLARAEAEARFDAMLEASPAAIYTLRVRDGQMPQLEWASPSVPRVLGLVEAGRPDTDWWRSVVHPEDFPVLMASELPTPATPATLTEYRVRGRDGGWRWVRDEQRLMQTEGSDRIVAGSWIDITERRTAEERLRELTSELEKRVEERTVELRSTNLALAEEVEERRRVQAQLERSERHFRSLIENASDVTVVFAADGRITYLSPSVERVLGWPTAEMIGQPFMPYLHPEEAARGIERFGELLTSAGSTLRGQYRLRHADGTWHVMELTSRNLVGDPAVRGVVCNGRDVTEQVAAQAQLERSLSLLQATLESTADGILVVDPAGRLVSWNTRFREIWGIPAEVMELGDDGPAMALAMRHLDDGPAFRDAVQAVQARPEAESLDVVSLRDGRLFERFSRPQRVGDEIVGRVWSYRDITERERSRTEAERSLSLLQATLESTADGIVVVGLDRRMAHWNGRFLEMWGLAPDDLGGEQEQAVQRVAGRVDDPAAFLASIAAAAEDPLAESRDTVRLRDGRVFDSYSRPQRLGGRVVGRVWSYRDVTERVRAEEALRASEERFREIADNIHQVFYVTELDEDRVSYVSPAFEDIFGMPGDALLDGRGSWMHLLHPDDRERFLREAAAMADTGDAAEYAYRIIRPDGDVRWLHTRDVPVRDASGRVYRRAGITEDVTDRVLAEKAVHDSEARFREIAETVHGVFYVSDIDPPRVTYVSPAYERVFGYDPADLLADVQVWLGYIHPEDRPVVAGSFGARGTPVETTYRFIRGDGEERWMQTRGYPVLDADGVVRRSVGVTEDVTDRVAAERALAESEARFREIAEALHGVFYVVEMDPPRALYLSPAFERVFGRPPDEVLSRIGAWHEYIHPDDRAAVAEALVPGRDSVEVTYRIIRPGGEVRWLHTRGFPVRQAGTRTHRSVGITEDVTDRVAAEQALAASEERFRQIAENIREVFYIEDVRSGRMLYVSPAFEEIWGRPRETLLANPEAWLESIHPDDVPAVWDRQAPEEVQESSYRIVRPDGDVRWIRSRGFPVRDEAGRVYRLAGLAEDVTERVMADEALRAGEQRFRQIAETIREVFYIYDLDELRLLYVSPAYQQIWGRATADVLRDPRAWFEGVHPEDAPGLARAMGTGGEEYEAEYRVVRPDGEVRWIWGRGFPVRDGAGRVYREVGIAEDVTARKAAEHAIRGAERRAQEMAARMRAVAAAAAAVVGATSPVELRNLLEEVTRGVLEFDLLLLLLYDPVEHVFHDLGGVDAGVVVEPGFIPAAGTPALRAVRERRTLVTLRSDDPAAAGALLGGTMRRSESIVRAPILAGGRVLGVFSVQSYRPGLYTPDDVEVVEALAALAATALENLRLAQEQRAAEEALHESQRQLLHSQKMEAVGRLAGGIAHDFNNMLMAIGGHAELLRTEPAMPEECRWQADEIHKAADRAAGLTRQLLAFSRKQVMQPRSLSVNAVISDMEDMLRRLIGETIRLRTVLDPGVGVVRADPGQLEQVLMNLVVNARDAMPAGGTVTLETGNVHLDGEYAGLHDEVIPGPYVMLAVADTGMGIEPAVRQRIFEPFFTTKPQGKGTGLGLSTVYGVVRQSGGHVWVYSELGVGTTFKIYLPREDAPSEPAEAPALPARMEGGSETILLVEDDEVVRELLRMFLQRQGYRVLGAGSGDEALRVAELAGAAPDLLLTDVVMPGMSGRELARAVRERWPQVGVIYMSGYTDDAIQQHGVLDPGSEFVQKPVSPDLLAHRIRAVLEER